MKTAYLFVILSIVLIGISSAIVQRHDVSEYGYIVKKAPPYLIDLPHEGHGVLIAERWILTVAHTIFYDYRGKNIDIGGFRNQIIDVIIHPEYKEIPKALLNGDSKPLMKFLFDRSDIALIKLKEPVKHVKPIELYKESNEKGKTIEIYGKGAGRNGLSGEDAETKKDKILRYCRNLITNTYDKWLSYVFDSAKSGITLEGMHGSSDNGRPSIIYIDKTPYLAGLSSWQLWNGDLSKFKGSLYGTTAYQVRISQYVDWVNSVIDGN